MSDHPRLFQPTPKSDRYPIPQLTYPTSTQRHLQQTLQTAARLIFAYDQSAQVGWLLFLLETLESHYKSDHWPEIAQVFDSLRTELAERLQAATW